MYILKKVKLVCSVEKLLFLMVQWNSVIQNNINFICFKTYVFLQVSTAVCIETSFYFQNSIRHNLSLHSRFMRIQNEGTGKSSWWVINPDAKPGKAPRRRAGSMETKNLEKKRGRIKKRIDAIRSAQENGTLSSEDFQDLQYHNFQNLSPEFRTRAGSNASSCGRLSPIQAAVEPDLHESQVPPMSPIPWGQEMGTDDFNTNSNEGYSTIADSLLVGLNIAEQANQGLSNDSSDIEMLGNSTVKPTLLSGSSMMRFNSQNSYDSAYNNLPAPPPYSDHMQQQQQQNSQTTTVLNLDSPQTRTYTNMSPSPMYQENIMSPPRPMMPGPSSNNLGISTQHSPARSPQMSPNYSPQGYVHSPQAVKRPQPTQQQLANQGPSPVGVPQGQQSPGGGRSLLQQCLESPPDSMLRAALTQQMNPTYQQPQQVLATQPQQFSQYTNNMYTAGPAQTLNLNNINNNQMNNMPQSTMSAFAQQSNMTSHVEPMPGRNESNMSLAEIDTNSMLDLDYDVEQLLRHELALDANLDFNFDGSAQNGPTSESRNMVR